MFELAQRARWLDVHDLLVSGHPPLYVQMLVVNVAVLMYVTLRGLFVKPATDRMKARSKVKSRYGVEGFVIAANAIILYENTWLPFVANSPVTLQIRMLLRI